MDRFQDRKQVLLNVLEQASRIARSRGNMHAVSEFAEEAQHLRAGELNVLICGEAKRGKSSLNNAFLDELEICPVDAPVATNAIMTIRHAKTERIVVHYRPSDGQDIVTVDIARSQLKDYVTEQGNQSNVRRVTLVEVFLVNPRLQDGLVLIDSPGIGGLNIEHTATTYRMVPYADAVVLVGAATQPLTDPEFDFAVRIGRHTRQIIYALTKRDCVDNWDDRLESDLARLHAALELPAGTIPGVAISSVLKQAYLASKEEELLVDSGFPEFERALWGLLERRGSILLDRARSRVLQIIPRIRLPLEAERAALETTSTDEIQKIEAELLAQIARAEELTIESPFWTADLNTQITVLQSEAKLALSKQFATLNVALDDYLAIPEYRNSPAKLGTMLDVDVNNSFAATIADVNSKLKTMVQELRTSTALNLNLEREGQNPEPLKRVTVKIKGEGGHRPETSRVKQVSDIGRSSAMHALGLGTAGSLTGMILGGIIGTFAGPAGTAAGAAVGAKLGGSLGALIGTGFGVKRGFNELEARDENWLKQNLRTEAFNELQSAERTSTHQLTVIITSERNIIHQGLLRDIQSDKDACAASVKALRTKKTESGADLAKRIRLLVNDIKMLDNLAAAAGESSDGADSS